VKHRIVEYAIDYLGEDGRRRGQETCTLSVHADGRRTLRARSEIFDSEVLRDVVQTVDREFRPVDALVRVSVKDRTVGTAFFRFEADHAECEAFTSAEGRLSQRLPLPRRAVSFISHAVSGDVWHGAGIERTDGIGPQPLEPVLSCSPLHNGASGPSLVRWPLRAHWLGTETIEVPAGRFLAEHIRYEEPNGDLFLDTWCTADGDRIMLRMFYPPYRSSYLLRTWTRSAVPPEA
jgi:hypothetical protein